MKKLLSFFAILLIVIPGIMWGYKWITFRLNYVISNAVFVESDKFVKVSFKRVSGRIEKMYKKEGDFVRKGEVLAKIEDKDYRIQLDRLNYSINSIEKEIEALKIAKERVKKKIKNSLEKLKIKREEVKHKLKAIEVKLKDLERNFKRFEKLFNKGVIPKRKLEEVQTAYNSLKEEYKANLKILREVDKEIENLKVEEKRVKEIQKKIEALKEKKKAFEKQREDVKNLIEYTILRSPIDGYVVKKFFNEGELVSTGQYVYAIYNPESSYILVLLDERKLKDVKVGSKAIIKIDAYPDITYEGIVKEINMSTAAKFAIIPRDITAGEFTKVSQRIPVKIEITKGDKSILRLGMSGEVYIKKSRP